MKHFNFLLAFPNTRYETCSRRIMAETGNISWLGLWAWSQGVVNSLIWREFISLATTEDTREDMALFQEILLVATVLIPVPLICISCG